MRLAAQGVALVLLRERSKRPVLDTWTTLPRMTPEAVDRRYAPGQNIGIRLGEPSEVGNRRFVHGVDIDIRDPAAEDEAWGALLDRFPTARSWPRVLSGSGGASVHLYVLTDAPFRKVNISRSRRLVTVQTSDGSREKPAWEIDFYGTGAQMVLPPSVHPDTGREYRWADREPDFRDLPFVRQTVVGALFAERQKRVRRNVETEPLDSLDEILNSRTFDNEGDGLHYDDWRDVIFAVKQEYDGTDQYDEAFQILEEWSQQSDKHDQKRFEEVWDHARTDRHDGITLGSLKKKYAPELDETRKARILAEMRDERPRTPSGEPLDDPKNGDWLRKCVRDNFGAFTNCAENRVLFLKNQSPMEHLVWAEEEQRPVWRRPARDEDAPLLRHLTFPEGAHSLPYDPKSHYQVLQMCFRRAPFYLDSVKKEELNDSVWLVAQQRPWRRIEEMLTRETWDGKPRVEGLLTDYLGAADTPYTRAVSRLLVLGPMCRVLWRAVKVDYSPILQGEQGSGKDRFLELLCSFDEESLYTATSFDIKKPSEYVQSIRGKLIVHLAEMATFRRSSNEDMKTFLTEHEDTARLSYEPLARTYRRTCIFVFSVNGKGGYLTDNTGNRRYLPVELGDPKLGRDGKPTTYRKRFDELERVRGQIWAEAYDMAMREADRQGGRVRELLLDAEALETAREMQADKMAETPEHDLVARGARLLNETVPLDDLIDDVNRTEKTARQVAVRNQVSPREFWIDVLGEKRETWFRNSQLSTRALDMMPGWERAGRQRHRGEVRVVYRRTGTDGRPEVKDDIVREERTSNVLDMTDERRRRR